MAFEKRTWLARIGTGLNKFIIGEKDANDRQTLTNAPDLPLTQEGDVISAENLNDLEDRIDNEFTSQDTRISNNATAIVNLNNNKENKLVKVWQNPDPWDSYGYDSDTIQLTESINEYVVEFITDLISGENHSTTFARFKVPSYGSPLLSGRTVLFSASEYNKIVTRPVTVRNNSTGFYFSPNLGYRYNMETQTLTTSLSTVCIPVAIYKVV